MTSAYSGRPLRLPVPPTALNMTALAMEASRSVEANTGKPLSFAIGSVAEVDGYLGEIREEVGGSDELAELVLKFGAYLGEMIVRHKGGTWADAPAEFDGWPVVQLPSGYWADPIGKAFKRVDNGSEDSIISFVDVLADLGQTKPQRRFHLFKRRV
ncbi:hypothetical protein [Lysinibacter cavernae]|uniref:DUF3806 domain-containing protein n=1 Tax=Lysinibacter cavernae TaxID=1640652 RepID=A0A7X5R045_9MICO|nr:hypothetical protein [Lysinibacter cavernae]NIH52985.1 hypothetical protein [Lysinibacter cavernae]